jgi:predicted NBD/HSP70 family sugar kinase
MGGGFLLNGKIYRGMSGEHPEIAHQSIHYRCSNPEKIVCECGSSDCLEALVSGNGIRRIYQKSAEELSDQEWEEVTYNIAQGIRNLIMIYLPDVIVLGGGIACGRGERLIHEINNILDVHIKIIPKSQLRLSKLGYQTALMGALVVAQQGLG